MGAKALFAAATEGDVREALRLAQPAAADAAELLGSWLPDHRWSEPETSTLDDVLYPRDAVGALRVGGVDLVCSEDVLTWLDDVPAAVRAAVGARRLTVMAMHSVTDSLAFAVWQDGVRIRMLGVDPEDGVSVDEGPRLAPELPFWAGEHPVGDGYPLPFHPLDLGEELLRDTLGFVIEGSPASADVDPFEVPAFAFQPAAAPAPAAADPGPGGRRRWFSRRR